MLVLHVPHMQDNPNPVLLTTHSKTYQVLIKVLQASLVSGYLETRRVEIEERAISVHQSVYKRNARFFSVIVPARVAKHKKQVVQGYHHDA